MPDLSRAKCIWISYDILPHHGRDQGTLNRKVGDTDQNEMGDESAPNAVRHAVSSGNSGKSIFRNRLPTRGLLC